MVYVGRLLALGDIKQRVFVISPPGRRGRDRRGFRLLQLLPGWAKHPALVELADQQPVQLLDQAVSMLGVDHEGQVKIIGRLGHQMHRLLLKDLQCRPELVENGADLAPDQGHGCAVLDDAHATQTPEVIRKQIQGARIDRAGAGIDGYCDVTF